MLVLETERLVLRRFTLDDAEFIFRLVNDPSWLRFIGDKNVHNLDDARRYLREGPLDMYQRFGFGMFRVEERASGLPTGMCGLIKRDTLPDVDVGYAFLPEFRGKGYAFEAANAVWSMAIERSVCGASSRLRRPAMRPRFACWRKPA